MSLKSNILQGSGLAYSGFQFGDLVFENSTAGPLDLLGACLLLIVHGKKSCLLRGNTFRLPAVHLKKRKVSMTNFDACNFIILSEYSSIHKCSFSVLLIVKHKQ